MKLEFDAFMGKNCRLGDHSDCAGYWKGMEIEVTCECNCHKNGLVDQATKQSRLDAVPALGTEADVIE